MNSRDGALSILAALLLFGPVATHAQTKDVTVSFLRAAASSLPDRATVSFDAIFIAQQGMVEPQGWNMRGRRLSRFSVRDPQSPQVFANMYCSQDSKVFKELVGLDTNRMIHVTGYKDSGENNQPSIFVTSVEVSPVPVGPAPDDTMTSARSLRVVVKDTTSGTKTVLVNVVPGKTYSVDNLVITVELENAASPAVENEDTGMPKPGVY